MAGESVRHQILRTMVDKFLEVKPPEWPLEFSVVELGPLGDEDHRKRYSIGIVPVRERFSNLYPYLVRHLTVGIEFRITVNRGDPSSGDMAEQVLTVIEKVVLDNGNWGGLAIDTELRNSEVDMTTYGDRTIMGVLWVEVQYRHSGADPRDPSPTI